MLTFGANSSLVGYRSYLVTAGAAAQALALRVQSPYTGVSTPPSPEIPKKSQKGLPGPPRPECQKTLRAKGALISEPRFSTPCEMRFFPREKGKTAFVEVVSLYKGRFPFLAWEKSHLAGGRKSGLTN